mgnify:CR=1 FL=1
MVEACELSALDARRQIKEGTLTSENLIQSCLKRSDMHSETVGAWTFIDPELALLSACLLYTSDAADE